MIDMSGWASIGMVCDGSDHTLTRASGRAPLDEGAECRSDIERQRAPLKRRFGGRVCKVCGVLCRHGYRAGP